MTEKKTTTMGLLMHSRAFGIGVVLMTLVSACGGQSDSGGSGAGASGSGNASAADLAECTTHAFDYSVLDAAYSEALGRLVLLTPIEAVVVDPVTLIEIHIGFGPNATGQLYGSIALAPDGKSAAVSRENTVSIIDLVAETLKATIPSTFAAGDVALAANGYAYVLPYEGLTGKLDFALHSFDLANGTEHGDDSSAFIAADTPIKLQPGGTSIYAVEHVLPAHLERFDISKGDAVGPFQNLQEQQGPEHKQCGDLWFNSSGTQIINSCGTVFKAAPGATDDMTYVSSLAPLPNSTPVDAPFGNFSIDDAHDRIYALAGAQYLNDPQQAYLTERTLAWYGYASQALLGTKEVPCMVIRGHKTVVTARFVFHTADGAKVLVLTDQNSAGQAGLAVFDAE